MYGSTELHILFVIEKSAFVCDAFPIILTHISREGAFSGLDSLEWLKLEDNAISALAGGDLFPASLKVTFLHWQLSMH